MEIKTKICLTLKKKYYTRYKELVVRGFVNCITYSQTQKKNRKLNSCICTFYWENYVIYAIIYNWTSNIQYVLCKLSCFQEYIFIEKYTWYYCWNMSSLLQKTKARPNHIAYSFKKYLHVFVRLIVFVPIIYYIMQSFLSQKLFYAYTM